jgi:hypothetical protein
MFRVVWLQEALDDLAAVWVKADSVLREAITTAANAIDQELTSDPYRNSESRDDDTRVLFAYPLALQIDVDLEQRVVWVLHAWRFRRRGES